MKGVPHPPRCRGSNPGASLIRTRSIAQTGEEKVAMAPAPPPAPEVLIIEDQFDLRETLADLLELEGYRVQTAANGQEALDHLHRAARPQVILLDLRMPRSEERRVG